MDRICDFEDCDHLTFGTFMVCACHLDMRDAHNMSRSELMEAIRVAALENEKFEVNGDGQIRIKEES